MSALLDAVRQALREPFADPVTIEGVTVPRSEARAAERLLGKIRKNRLLAPTAPTGARISQPEGAADDKGTST